MKQLIIILTLLFTSLNGYCDTLDYWHVYVNDSLVAEFNSTSNDLTINLKRTELKISDTITVRHGTDHPCSNCHYGLNVLVEIKEKTPKVEVTENFGKLSIPLSELYDIQKKYDLNKSSLMKIMV